jgi:hypothetical protein
VREQVRKLLRRRNLPPGSLAVTVAVKPLNSAGSSEELETSEKEGYAPSLLVEPGS